MEAQTLPETEQDGAPSENGAEATRTAAHLFEYSQFVHVGVGAEECEHREDGKCAEPDHFHGWVCLPNTLQHRDILEKARAAKARRRRALRDAGDATHAATDAYVTLESDLDDLLAKADREGLLKEIADREVRKGAVDRVREVREDDERFENYWQDREEWLRMKEMDDEARPAEEFESLDREMTDFEEALEARSKADTERELAGLRGLSAERLREVVREVRIDGEAAEAHLHAYYMWMGFIGTRVPGSGKRSFQALEDFRNASPEVVDAIDLALRDLEGRMNRGEAAGN